MWQVWGAGPSENVGWLLLEEVRFEEQARWRCNELAGHGYRTAMRNAETGETAFNPRIRPIGAGI